MGGFFRETGHVCPREPARGVRCDLPQKHGCARGRWHVRVWGAGLGLSLMTALLPTLKRVDLSPALRGPPQAARRRKPAALAPLWEQLRGAGVAGTFQRGGRLAASSGRDHGPSRVASEAPRGRNRLKVQLCKASAVAEAEQRLRGQLPRGLTAGKPCSLTGETRTDRSEEPV